MRGIGYMHEFIQNLRSSKVFLYIDQIRNDGQRVRFYIQMIFFIVIVWIGFDPLPALGGQNVRIQFEGLENTVVSKCKDLRQQIQS